MENVGLDLDAHDEREGRHWQASPQARFERLLRETSPDYSSEHRM
jgi:hypothetical protein